MSTKQFSALYYISLERKLYVVSESHGNDAIYANYRAENLIWTLKFYIKIICFYPNDLFHSQSNAPKSFLKDVIIFIMITMKVQTRKSDFQSNQKIQLSKFDSKRPGAVNLTLYQRFRKTNTDVGHSHKGQN